MTKKNEPTSAPSVSAQNLRDKIAELPALVVENVANSATNLTEHVAQKTTAYLIAELESRLATLIAQDNAIQVLKSNLDLLTQKYKLNKSRLTQAADWYGQRTWLQKAALGIAWGVLTIAASILASAIITLGAAAGAAGSVLIILSAVIALLVAGLYYKTASLLMEHYNVISGPGGRDEKFCNDILDMETKLAASIEYLQKIKNDADIILVALNNNELQSAQHLLAFEKKVSLLNNQIEDFIKTINASEKTTEALIQQNATMAERFTAIQAELNAAQNTISEQSNKFDSLNNQFAHTNQSLLEREEELMRVHEKFNESLLRLAEYEILIQAQIPPTQNNNTTGENQTSINPTPHDNNITTIEFLEKSDKLIREKKPLDDAQSQAAEDNETALFARFEAFKKRAPIRSFTP